MLIERRWGAGVLCKFGDKVVEALFDNQTPPVQNVTSPKPSPKSAVSDRFVSAGMGVAPTPQPTNTFMNSVV